MNNMNIDRKNTNYDSYERYNFIKIMIEYRIHTSEIQKFS